MCRRSTAVARAGASRAARERSRGRVTPRVAADIELLVFADEDLPEVAADGHAIEQILLNLVNNRARRDAAGGVLRLETAARGSAMRSGNVLGPGAASEYVCLASTTPARG